MATCTFNGDGDGSDWDDPDNWDTDSVPTSADNVVIPAGFSVNNYNSYYYEAGNILINSGGSLDLVGSAGYASVIENYGTLSYSDSNTYGVTVTAYGGSTSYVDDGIATVEVFAGASLTLVNMSLYPGAASADVYVGGVLNIPNSSWVDLNANIEGTLNVSGWLGSNQSLTGAGFVVSSGGVVNLSDMNSQLMSFAAGATLNVLDGGVLVGPDSFGMYIGSAAFNAASVATYTKQALQTALAGTGTKPILKYPMGINGSNILGML